MPCRRTVEGFFRTLKEQVICWLVFANLDEVRQAVGEFVERYSSQWLVEKNGYRSPLEMRELYYRVREPVRQGREKHS